MGIFMQSQAWTGKFFGRKTGLLKLMTNWKLLFEVEQLIHPLGSDVIYTVEFDSSHQLDACQINAKNGELLKNESAVFTDGFSGALLSPVRGLMPLDLFWFQQELGKELICKRRVTQI